MHIMKKRVTSLALVLALLLSLLPMTAFAAERDTQKDQVHVIVENTTFTPETAESLDATWDDGFWYGTLVDTWVDLTDSATMMSCVGDALSEKGYTAQGLDSGYISEINGLGEFDGGSMSGWMGTLNDWFTDQAFSYYTVADGTLESGDEIRVMYTTNWGSDLGSNWGSTDTSLKALTFSTGILSPAFAGDTLEYTLSVPYGTRGLTVTPTAVNKNFQTHILVGETEYKRTATVPVEDGTVITVRVSDATVYTVTVKEKAPLDTTLSSQWPSFRGNDANNGVTPAETPRDAEETELKWVQQVSTGWSDAPSPMILVDDTVVTMAGSTLKKLSVADGSTVASATMDAATSWGSTPPYYADGYIFCQLNGGKVQAFNAKTLESLWVYTDENGGQAQSPIAYSGGKVYVGFGYGKEYAFVCLNANDGSLVWREVDSQGYYWAGAVVAGDYVICGNDNGTVTSRNNLTGELVSELSVGEKVRSSICYDGGRIFFTAYNAQLCWADLNGETGELTNLTKVDCSAYGSNSTSTPAVYNGIAYIGVGGWSGNKSVVAVDTGTGSILWNIDETAYPQCSVLLSTAYVDDGYIYLYVTYNNYPGGINVIKAKADGSEATQETLYTPDSDYQQYCVCSVIADADGNLYYKNDSGNVFAIGMTQDARDQLAAQAVIALIDGIGEVTADSYDVVTAAREAYNALTEAQQALVTNYDVLTAAEELLALWLLPHADFEDIYKTTGDNLEALAGETAPTVASIGGDWMVIGLARSGRAVPEGYYENVLRYVEANINEKQQLHRAKSTDNARVILALTAIGKDVTDVGGHNLLQGLTDMNYVTKQGINGPVWALIAFDSGNYRIPEAPEGAEPVTREALIAAILDAQLSDGGWALSGAQADPDMTGMAIQALAPYYAENEQVRSAVDAGLEVLSSLQGKDGGYSSWDTPNCESCAQVIVALTALGIDPNTDARFVKNGRSVVDALCGYYVEGGSFRHLADGDADGMATEQAYYALAARFRFLEGKTSLYDMTDVARPVFVDVSESAYYYDAVSYLAVHGYVNGTDATHFSPYEPLTRGQLVTILYRMAGEPAVTGTAQFPDVTPGAYYYDAVIWAGENGITLGYGDGTFQPNRGVSRQELVTFLYRYAGADAVEEDGLSRFPDTGAVSGFAAEAMNWAVSTGLVRGTAEGFLEPGSVSTRCQAAAILYRFATR